MLDGFPVDWGKRIEGKYGFTGSKYFRVTDLGYKKEQTPVTEYVIKTVYEKVEIIY